MVLLTSFHVFHLLLSDKLHPFLDVVCLSMCLSYLLVHLPTNLTLRVLDEAEIVLLERGLIENVRLQLIARLNHR